MKLVLGIVLVLVFMFGIVPPGNHLSVVQRMGQLTDERNLRAIAIYCTDLEEPAEGLELIRKQSCVSAARSLLVLV